MVPPVPELQPAAEAAPDLGLGHDALVLLGLFALAHFAIACASWDVSNGFSLMGASRDLMLSVFVEATFVLSLAIGCCHRNPLNRYLL